MVRKYHNTIASQMGVARVSGDGVVEKAILLTKFYR